MRTDLEGSDLVDGNGLRPLIRKKVGDYLFPYGTFPDEDYPQVEGYHTEYFTAPSGSLSAGDQPASDRLGDRYRTVLLVSAEKIAPIFLELCEMLPDTVRVVLERASEDVYTDRDVFVSEIDVACEEFVEVFKAYEFTFCEDGMLGVGAFAPEQPVEIFLTDHKEIVIFSEDAEEVHKILRKHKLQSRDAGFYYEVPHQHVALTEYRGLRGAQFDYFHVADALRQVFSMSLQLEEDRNVDERGNPIGLVPWRAVVVANPLRRARSSRRRQRSFGQEFLLTAKTRREAEMLLEQRLKRDGYSLQQMSELFRLDLAGLPREVQPAAGVLRKPGIWFVGDRRESPGMGWH